MELSPQCTHTLPRPLSLSSCHAWHIVVNSICILLHIPSQSPSLFGFSFLSFRRLPSSCAVYSAMHRRFCFTFHVSRLFFQGLFLFYSEFANKAEAGNNFCCFTDGPDGRERNGKSHIKMALNGFGRRVSASVLLIALSLLSGALILPPAAAQRDENVG